MAADLIISHLGAFANKIAAAILNDLVVRVELSYVRRLSDYAFMCYGHAEISQDLGIWIQKLNCWNCNSDANFTVTNSANGGIDVNFDSCRIHVPVCSSVHHPLIQMVLFAEYHLSSDNFSCPKSMVPKSIIDVVQKSTSSASPNVYEADSVPAESQPEFSDFEWASRFDPVDSVDRSSHQTLPVLFDKSTNKVTSKTVDSTEQAGRDILVIDSGAWMSITDDVAKMKTLPTCVTNSWNMDKAPRAAGLACFMTSSGTSMLIPGASLHQQLVMNNQADERSDKPRSNSAPSDTSSDETKRVPKEHKLTDNGSHNKSEPNHRVAEGHTMEEAKRSGEWFFATGAAHHATGDSNLITNMMELENDGLCVHAADGTPMPVRGRGSVVTDTVVLPDVYYVPGLWTNLVSVGQLAGLDYCVGFGRGACVVTDAAGTVVGRAHSRGDGLYEVDFLRVPLSMPGN